MLEEYQSQLDGDSGMIKKVIGSAAGIVRELADVVQAPDLGGVHSDLGGEPVDRTLDHLDRFGPAGAAEGGDLRGVRDHRRPLRLEPGAPRVGYAPQSARMSSL